MGSPSRGAFQGEQWQLLRHWGLNVSGDLQESQRATVAPAPGELGGTLGAKADLCESRAKLKLQWLSLWGPFQDCKETWKSLLKRMIVSAFFKLVNCWYFWSHSQELYFFLYINLYLKLGMLILIQIPQNLGTPVSEVMVQRWGRLEAVEGGVNKRHVPTFKCSA